MSLTNVVADLQVWWMSLNPEFMFLLLLPVAVAIAGLAAEALRRRNLRPAGERDGGWLGQLRLGGVSRWTWPAGLGAAVAASIIAAD